MQTSTAKTVCRKQKLYELSCEYASVSQIGSRVQLARISNGMTDHANAFKFKLGRKVRMPKCPQLEDVPVRAQQHRSVGAKCLLEHATAVAACHPVVFWVAGVVQQRRVMCVHHKNGANC